jgi:hypothetical protein
MRVSLRELCFNEINEKYSKIEILLCDGGFSEYTIQCLWKELSVVLEIREYDNIIGYIYQYPTYLTGKNEVTISFSIIEKMRKKGYMKKALKKYIEEIKIKRYENPIYKELQKIVAIPLNQGSENVLMDSDFKLIEKDGYIEMTYEF